MTKYNVGDNVIFTIHKTKYPATIIAIDIIELLYKIHNIDNNNVYWVEQNRLSKIKNKGDI